MSAADGGPAFPAQFFDERATEMTLRDHFASKVLPALITSTASWRDLGLIPKDGLTDQQQYAMFAYQYADAMLAARKKGTT